jgi:tRNA/rRNA methyltransferase
MALDNIVVVLVGTLYGGNVGSTCRAMANMGIKELRLVNPRETIEWEDATRMACHATPILEARKHFTSLEDAVSDCVAVVGTTARQGLYRQHALSPREQAPKLLQLAEQGKVALVFGREDKGLLNDEVSLCSHLVQIPTDSEYSSLNLSQAVMVLCYELFATRNVYEPIQEKSELAPAQMRNRMFDMWRELLLHIGFMEEKKAEHMMAGINRIFSRGALTINDVNIMMGIVRQTYWAVDHDKHNRTAQREKKLAEQQEDQKPEEPSNA